MLDLQPTTRGTLCRRDATTAKLLLAINLLPLNLLPLASHAALPGDEVRKVLAGVDWDAEPPFSKGDFRRLDESDDFTFYDSPRLVYHVDMRPLRRRRRTTASSLATSHAGGARKSWTCWTSAARGCPITLRLPRIGGSAESLASG